MLTLKQLVYALLFYRTAWLLTAGWPKNIYIYKIKSLVCLCKYNGKFPFLKRYIIYYKLLEVKEMHKSKASFRLKHKWEALFMFI